MIREVNKIFDQELDKLLYKNIPALNFVKKHERRHICVEHICEQIKLAERSNIVMDVVKYDMMIRTVARLFAKLAIDHKHEQILSDAERTRRIREADKLKEAEGALSELNEDTINEKPKSHMYDATRSQMQVRQDGEPWSAEGASKEPKPAWNGSD